METGGAQGPATTQVGKDCSLSGNHTAHRQNGSQKLHTRRVIRATPTLDTVNMDSKCPPPW